MHWISRLFDKTGAIGVLIATMGCASCFPALGSLGAALGLGFLAHYEGVFINTLLPVFAWLGLLANTILFINHKVFYRFIAGIIGPVMILLTMGPLWIYAWSTYLLYAGIVIMLLVSLWDVISPARSSCKIKQTENREHNVT